MFFKQSNTEEDAGKYCPFEVEKAKLGEAVAEVSAAGKEALKARFHSLSR